MLFFYNYIEMKTLYKFIFMISYCIIWQQSDKVKNCIYKSRIHAWTELDPGSQKHVNLPKTETESQTFLHYFWDIFF